METINVKVIRKKNFATRFRRAFVVIDVEQATTGDPCQFSLTANPAPDVLKVNISPHARI